MRILTTYALPYLYRRFHLQLGAYFFIQLPVDLVLSEKRPKAGCKISEQRHGSLPTRSPKFCRLRPLACPILVFRCRASFVPSPSGCSTLPACCFQWVSIRHRLARPSLVVEWREITSPHSGGKRPCSSARFARKSRIHA